MFAHRIFRRASLPLVQASRFLRLIASQWARETFRSPVGLWAPCKCLSGDTPDCFCQSWPYRRRIWVCPWENSIRCSWFDSRPIVKSVTGISECLIFHRCHRRSPWSLVITVKACATSLGSWVFVLIFALSFKLNTYLELDSLSVSIHDASKASAETRGQRRIWCMSRSQWGQAVTSAWLSCFAGCSGDLELVSRSECVLRSLFHFLISHHLERTAWSQCSCSTRSTPVSSLRAYLVIWLSLPSLNFSSGSMLL